MPQPENQSYNINCLIWFILVTYWSVYAKVLQNNFMYCKKIQNVKRKIHLILILKYKKKLIMNFKKNIFETLE